MGKNARSLWQTPSGTLQEEGAGDGGGCVDVRSRVVCGSVYTRIGY